ncbi:Serine/threonine protein kinase [Nostoc flagelliforme CCNUN1]|uniref:Serine/threonine protein kinase n=1 Tax=Nostoc flagelliforme CCNUN1 TaxID=2038116 RepID=A0A2K8SMV7_9NOSO|nr:hypothetical protein [Nostoc flagelliforme]AUB36792.1 Serine/threonine protein kinase [Nostoc flagelliforme CCNUN1]
MVWNPGQQLFGDRYIIERKLGEGRIAKKLLPQSNMVLLFLLNLVELDLDVTFPSMLNGIESFIVLKKLKQ